MADMSSRRVEIVFMMRGFLSLELVRVPNDFCASLEMPLSTVRALGQESKMRCRGNESV
jgi:hypothetical protein